jgi:DNA-binding MarR family transcriptional regulator
MIDASRPAHPASGAALSAPSLGTSRASPLFLREAEIRRGIELLYFGYGNMIRGADVILGARGLGRAHHRSLYFIGRQPGLAVSDLLRLLAITKQSLSRVLADLMAQGLVAQQVGTHDRRQRLLSLTAEGSALETELFEALKERMASAYGQAGQQAVGGFWAVLAGLIPPEDRAIVEELVRRSRLQPAARATG